MNIEALLQPIRPEAPFGDDLSFSVEFDDIREKRREDDPSLAQGEWKKAVKVADWDGVVRQCEELLRLRTKDLRVVGWFADALARTRGFAGLADGLTVAALLCESQWENLYPVIEDGDIDQRVGSLAWLLGQVAELTRRATLLEGRGQRLSLQDIERARALQQQILRGTTDAATAAAQGSLTLDEVTRVQAATPRESLLANLADVQRAIEALSRLERAVDAYLGSEGPAFGPPRKALGEALESVQRLAGQDAAPTPGERVAAAVTGRLPAAADPDGTLGAAQPMTRALALQQLRTVAEFFRRTEPHSPVAYLADKAAQWGDMPLHAWLRMVLKDPGALAHVEELLGVEPPSETPPSS